MLSGRFRRQSEMSYGIKTTPVVIAIPGHHPQKEHPKRLPFLFLALALSL
jgi:hypothetical protein